ncbi:hypothetical protein [Saccharopolyspora sp. 5N708]|uniref:hypothetical protein n=1 Tax=Saccharopolyspora sp. 5N708 TaxID=3457424 RepID=UPI003FD27C49
MFSEAQFGTVIDQLTAGTEELNRQIARIGPAAASAIESGWVSQPVKDAIEWCAQELEEAASEFYRVIVDLLKAAIAPVLMYQRAWEWQNLRGQASGVADCLTPEALNVDNKWHGEAATAYAKTIKRHSKAAARIAAIASRIVGSLVFCASAGLAFYVALGFVVAKYIQTIVVAIAAIESGVFSLGGAVLFVAETAVDSALTGALVVGLVTLIGIQVEEMIALHGEAVDPAGFPDGWPKPGTTPFNDATVTDGDADWSLA